jgi:hypothetical protein
MKGKCRLVWLPVVVRVPSLDRAAVRARVCPDVPASFGESFLL